MESSDGTYQRVQQPHACSEVEYPEGIEQKSDRYTDKDNWVVQVKMVSTNLVKIDLHEQSEHEYTPTR
jgi:hypothetical protein